ncbi:MAG: ATP synthase F1 subunit delta [Armatimonadota bacterium]|nr:ATP synthase F1 subunit delta [Armatimonadota bacterium]
MIGRSVARRYLSAAMEAAQRAGVRDELGQQLEIMRALVDSTPDLRRLLAHPTMQTQRKVRALSELMGEEPVGPLRRLIELLVDNDRIEVLEIADEVYQELVDEADGVLRAFVTTPMPLADGQAERLAGALSGWLGQDVVVDERIDPETLGGIVVRVGDRILDASLRGRLDRIHSRMVE